MSALDTMQGFLEKHVGPIALKVSEYKIIRGLMTGMMATMPVTLGVAFLSIISGLPTPPLQEFLTSTGLEAVISDVLVVTMNMGALYMAASVSYNYGKVIGASGLTSMVATLGVLMTLIPLGTTETGVTYIPTNYLGSSGLFVALVVSIIVPAALNFLMKHLAIKMPDSVPQFVSDSLSPMFCAIILFTCAALLKWGMTLTSFNDVFDLVNAIIGAPVMMLGTSPWAVLIYFTLCNLLFFFGVHPSVLMSVYMPVMAAVGQANIAAYLAGEPLPYLQYTILMSIGSLDALGMVLALLTAKSERYKTLSRIAVVPAVFNISEPILFGTPIAMNPYMFIPYILLKPIAWLIAFVGFSFGLGAAFNPTIAMPFVVPVAITTFLQGGVGLLVISVVATLAIALLFIPFVRMADAQALKEEAQAKAEAEAEAAA